MTVSGQSAAYIRGHLHYWYGGRPNEYDKGSVDYADWQTGFEDAAEEDRCDNRGPEDEYLYTQE